MSVVEQRDSSVVALSLACTALCVSRASLYRDRKPPEPRAPRARPPSPRALGDGERKRILDTMHEPEFADQPPTEVYATLLGRGIYPRVDPHLLPRARRCGRARRAHQRPAQTYAKPSLTACAPNEVWTWDITKLATMQRGVFLFAYVIIDLFSRYVVGWMLATKECKHLAAQLFAQTVARHDVEPGVLTVHMDRGSAMKSDTLAQLLASVGASRSFSRPHVSDDNAFSESQFKTLRSIRPVHGGAARPRVPRATTRARRRVRLAPRAIPSRPASRAASADGGPHQPARCRCRTRLRSRARREHRRPDGRR